MSAEPTTAGATPRDTTAPQVATGKSPGSVAAKVETATTPPGGTPVAAPPPGAPPAIPAAGASDALVELQRFWPEIVAWISRNPPTKPLIAVCRPISVDGNVVTLGFPEGQAFLRDVAERRRGILEEGVAKFLGHPVAVRCVATNLEIAAPAPSDEDRARLLDEARRIFADDLVDVGEVN